jgi:hypothetical protein
VHDVRPPGKIHGRPHQHLVHRDGRRAVPPDAGLVAERPREGVAQRDGRVLHRVVRVDLEVTLGAYGQVEAAVLGQLVEHVVVEPHAGGQVALAGAVEVDLDEHLGLIGDALDARGASH